MELSVGDVVFEDVLVEVLKFHLNILFKESLFVEREEIHESKIAANVEGVVGNLDRGRGTFLSLTLRYCLSK